jgi:hypothetical protein
MRRSVTVQRCSALQRVATCCVLFVADFIPKDSPAYGMVMRARMAAQADKMQREQAAIAAGHAKVRRRSRGDSAAASSRFPAMMCPCLQGWGCPVPAVVCPSLPLCASSITALLGWQEDYNDKMKRLDEAKMLGSSAAGQQQMLMQVGAARGTAYNPPLRRDSTIVQHSIVSGGQQQRPWADVAWSRGRCGSVPGRMCLGPGADVA